MPIKRNSPFETVSSRVAWSCPWFNVRQDEIVTPDGRPGIYNIVEKANSAWIVPVTKAGTIALIYHYRYTVKDWCWEVPAGSMEPTHSNIHETAIAELKEEIGGTAEEITYVNQFYVANGIFNEVGHIFLATGVTMGPTAHEPTEVMEIHTKPIQEVLQMARAGEIKDGGSALSLMLCSEQLQLISKGA